VEGYESDFLLQEAIEGGEECIESYHAYVRPGGQVMGEFAGRKLRTSPRRYGFSTCVEITDREDVLALGRSILEKIGFSGVVKIDFKREPSTGRLHLLELNPRFNLWHHPGAVAGVSLPALVYQDCVEPGSARPAGRAKAGVRWMSAREDYRAMREYRAAGELSFARWLGQLLTVTVNEGFLFRDPLPGLAGLGGTLRRKVARLLGRRPARPVAEHS
jgi:predicted ATP-grasp superfamily ATP-dependent carboligase